MCRPDTDRLSGQAGGNHVLRVPSADYSPIGDSKPSWNEDQEINIAVEIKVSRCERADKIGAEKVTSQCILNASDESLQD